MAAQVRSALAPPRLETHLKYAVEVQIARGTPMLGLLEPVLERVVCEDIPANLAALKQRVEDLRLQRRIAELEAQGAKCFGSPACSAPVLWLASSIGVRAREPVHACSCVAAPHNLTLHLHAVFLALPCRALQPH